jgi:hypothetical protein
MQISIDKELIDLWVARPTLSQADWTRLYGVVAGALSRCNPTLLYPLGFDKQSQVDDFFVAKIYSRSTWYAAAPYGIGGLCRYFSRFLTDQLRSADWRHQSAHVALEEADNEDTPESTFGDFDEVLRQVGRSELEIRESARLFMSGLEKWAVHLTTHACDEHAEALSKTASRLGIASYHYKALQLGITRKKGELYAGYETTLIGRWLTHDLGINIQPDNMREIFAVLKILCDEALSLCEDIGT